MAWDMPSIKHTGANLVMGMIGEIYEQDALPDWLRQGILSLIPKGEKDRYQLKNWRPLVLLSLQNNLWNNFQQN